MPVPAKLRAKLKERPAKKEKSPIDRSETDADLMEIVGELNRKHAVVMLGGRFAILNEVIDPVFNRPTLTFSALADFRAKYSNKAVSVPTRNGTRRINMAHAWLEHPGRREYEGIGFFPGGQVQQYFNLWRGFAVEPKKGDWSIFNEFIHETICGGDERNFEYILDWLADMVQNPGGERPGICIVLRGSQGTGKSTFAREVGSLLGPHYLPVSATHQFLGRFNSQLMNTLLLFIDEGVWAGDKTAEGMLKSLITEPMIMIEAKGRDAFQIKNHLRLIVASNNNWVIPAAAEERRFFVLDVAENHMQDKKFFAALRNQMDSGGRQAMFFDLLQTDLANANLRDPPSTTALFDQKVLTADSVSKWWYTSLVEGTQLRGKQEWQQACPTGKLHDDYVQLAKNLGYKVILELPTFAKRLRRLCPGVIGPRRLTLNETEVPAIRQKRLNCLVFPEIEDCRQQYEQVMRQAIEWPTDDDFDSQTRQG